MGPRSRERVEAIAEAVGHLVDELQQQGGKLDELMRIAGESSDQLGILNARLGETLASHEKQNTQIIRIERELRQELRDSEARLAR